MKNILSAANFFDLKSIRDLQIAPDGKTAVYVLNETNPEQNEKVTNLWQVAMDRSAPPRRLTNSGKDRAPRFSPDGSQVLFLSSRAEQGKTQFYSISLQGGEAEQISTEVMPVSAGLWSPDGKKIAFQAAVPPAEGPRYAAEPKELYTPGKTDKEKKEAPLVITDADYRADGKGYLFQSYLQLFVLDLSEKTAVCRQITEQKQRQEGFLWNRESNALYYVVRHSDQPGAAYRSRVCKIQLANGYGSEVMEFDGTIKDLLLTDEDSRFVWLGADNSQASGTNVERIWSIVLSGPQPLDAQNLVCLTENSQATRSNLRYAAEEKTLYYVKQQHASAYFCRLPYSDGQTGAESDAVGGALATVSAFAVNATGERVFLCEDSSHPADLYAVQDAKPLRLTAVNAEFLAKFPALPTEKFSYSGADGWDIEGFLVRPLDYSAGTRVATILSIHGGPTDVYMDSFQFPFQFLAYHGYAVVYVNPRGSITYGPQFAAACINDLGGKDYQDIMLGVDHVIAMGVADPNRLGVTGWSYGGYMTSWAVSQTKRFRAAVAGAIISNWLTLCLVSDAAAYGEGLHGGPAFDDIPALMARSPIQYVRQVETPILLLHGMNDVRCPQDQTEQFYYALKRLGKETVYVKYPEQFHGFVKPAYIADRWQRTLAWFQSHIN
ncbi:MAG: S9 family peptidase [Negativicutes bacterium]|nr:S9 family peptidase [Negativicutes bacterium]